MDNQKIIDDLNDMFHKPLPDFYKRRIVFWYDDEAEFVDIIDDIKLDNAKIVVLQKDTFFATKKLLQRDDVKSNFLIYRPFYVENQDNWLLNIEFYSESYRSDLISTYLDELGIEQTPAMRKSIKEYKKFFNSKERRMKFASVVAKYKISSPPKIHLAVMSVLSNASDIMPNNISKAVLCGGIEDNSIYNDFINYGADKPFLALVQQATGYLEQPLNIGALLTHILLTATTKIISIKELIGLEKFISEPHQSYCYEFIADWLYNSENESLFDLAEYVEFETKIDKRFVNMNYNDIIDVDFFPCINQCILTQIMSDIHNNVINVSDIKYIVEKRRSLAWNDRFTNYLDAVFQVANMQEFYNNFNSSMNILESNKMWEKYTENFYKMDTYYRLYHLAFTKALSSSNMELDDLLKQVTDVVEGLYSNWFLSRLGENWAKASEDELAKNGYLFNIPKQSNFYKEKVKKSENRVFVIISDALRYEVANSLSEQLQQETQAKVDLKSMQAVFPTITKFGMASLLPHKELTAEIRNDKLAILVDGSLTESNYRDKILKNHNPKSVAVQSRNIVKMKRAERSEIVKGQEVVYIYHDVIDEASHTSDTAVFPACEECISEIKNLIKIITNDFGGTRIFITSDHGFLYTYNPLQENDKADKSNFEDKNVEFGRRYAILKKEANPDYLMPVKFMNSDFVGYAPKESIRIKMNGGGQNFVHGGVSLQEMVVPLIEYHHLRNSNKEYLKNKEKYDTKPVELQLLSSSRKISNLMFSLDFYQKDAISHNRKQVVYTFYFVDENNTKVSDTQKIIADRINKNDQERVFRTRFSLKSIKYDKTVPYYLVISDDNGELLPQRVEFYIDIAFVQEEFNFFD